jgi:predicted dehydrogenase
MPDSPDLSRRNLLKLAGTAASTAAGAALASAAVTTSAQAEESPSAARTKPFRVGVISANIRGKSQPRNGHTWHFAQYLHPTTDLDAYKKHYPQALDSYQKVYRNPNYHFDLLPFPDTVISHYYDSDPAHAAAFAECYPGVQVATNLERMVGECDAIWLGDASGIGDDHFDLVAPGLAQGLPTFCDKPIGGTVAGTKKILDFAQQHSAKLMSGSIFNYEFGMEQAKRVRDVGEHGAIEHVSARLFSRYSLASWMIYGQHPVWTVMSLMGPGVEAVSMYEYKDTCHVQMTYADRYPCHAWFGQPYEWFEYDRTDVYFKKKLMSYTPSIAGDFSYGHHYQMFRMAATFRQMLLTGKEPNAPQEILEVTAVVHAGAKSLKEKSRLVKLSEVMG